MKMVTFSHFLFLSCLALMIDTIYGGAQVYMRKQPENGRNISVNVGGALNGSICIDCQDQVQIQEQDQKYLNGKERLQQLEENNEKLKQFASELVEDILRMADANTNSTEPTSTIQEESSSVSVVESAVEPKNQITQDRPPIQGGIVTVDDRRPINLRVIQETVPANVLKSALAGATQEDQAFEGAAAFKAPPASKAQAAFKAPEGFKVKANVTEVPEKVPYFEGAAAFKAPPAFKVPIAFKGSENSALSKDLAAP